MDEAEAALRASNKEKRRQREHQNNPQVFEEVVPPFEAVVLPDPDLNVNLVTAVNRGQRRVAIAHQEPDVAAQDLLIDDLGLLANLVPPANIGAAADGEAINLLNNQVNQAPMAQPNVRILSLKDLPSFGGHPYENASQFVQQFENYSQIYTWNEDYKLKHFKLALTHNAASWLYNFEKKKEEERANLNPGIGPLYNWADLKDSFLKMFGKTYIDYDLMGEVGRMKFAEDPLSYVLNMLTYLNETSPNASEKDKVQQLFRGLPTNVKVRVVAHLPDTVDQFIVMLQNLAREQSYVSKFLHDPFANSLSATAAMRATYPEFVTPQMALQSNSSNVYPGYSQVHRQTEMPFSWPAPSNQLVPFNPNLPSNTMYFPANFFQQPNLQGVTTTVSTVPNMTPVEVKSNIAAFATMTSDTTLTSLADTVNKLVSELKDMKANASNVHPKPITDNQQWRGNNYSSFNRPVCNYCKKPNHLARDCRTRLADQNDQNSNTRPRSNFNQNNNRYSSDKGEALQSVQPVYLIQPSTSNYLPTPQPLLSLPAPPENTIAHLAQQLCNQLSLNTQGRP